MRLAHLPVFATRQQLSPIQTIRPCAFRINFRDLASLPHVDLESLPSVFDKTNQFADCMGVRSQFLCGRDGSAWPIGRYDALDRSALESSLVMREGVSGAGELPRQPPYLTVGHEAGGTGSQYKIRPARLTEASGLREGEGRAGRGRTAPSAISDRRVAFRAPARN
jgi:hypothetical protein